MALEFLDALDKNTAGLQRAVVEELGRQFNTGYDNHITVALQKVRENASEMRFRIIGTTKVQSYRDYKKLKESHESDIECVNYVISIMVYFLPRLLKTLKVLEPKVKSFDSGGWGNERFGGANNATAIHNWLTKKLPGDKDKLPGGYLSNEVIDSFGNGLSTSASNLVGGTNGCLQVLCDRIERIASRYPPPTPLPAQSQGPPQPHQDNSHPPPEIQPSPTIGDSSTATIGGAVGATGLVGGGAAVYFLNVGGIRTLIAG